MYSLPIFPLNAVLFPGTPLQLHIFEDRYKKMIGECIDTQAPFGVVLIRKGVEANGPLAEPYDVGCTAEIIKVEKLDLGRMNILAIGQERFRIRTLDFQAQPYLVGNVDSLIFAKREKADGELAASHLHDRLLRYLQYFIEPGSTGLDPANLPVDPLQLAYLASALMQIPAEEKQELLEVADEISLIDDVNQILRRELVIIERMAREETSQTLPFSMN